MQKVRAVRLERVAIFSNFAVMKKIALDVYTATLYQLFVALFMLWLTRFLFIACNSEAVAVNSFAEAMRLSCAGLRFDLVVVAYFNSFFVLMRILPFDFVVRKRWYMSLTTWIFGISNAICLLLNFGDSVYYRFSGGRLRWSGIQEVTAESNLGGIVGGYMLEYWWMVIIFVLFVLTMMWLYNLVKVRSLNIVQKWKLWIVRVVMILLFGGCTVLAMRGRVGSGNPLNIADATWHVSEAQQINVVLNTPFTIMRSIGKEAGVEVLTFFSDEKLSKMRDTIHKPLDGKPFIKKNVLIIIIESGGSCFVDALSEFVGEREHLKGLMPFVDSLAHESIVVEHFMATGRRSNEGACAILGGFPSFEPLAFMLSPYAAKPFSSAASLLKSEGYETAFYYGCNHGSFNIDQLAHAAGYDKVVDRAAYGGKDEDYDHSWGIYDGPMGEFTAKDLNELAQPWIASWFTISAHGPFKVPPTENLDGYKYKNPSPERGLEYTDRSLRRFFEIARTMPWFMNTLFVITGDHGNRDMVGTKFDSPFIKYHVPLILYSPDGGTEPKIVKDKVGSQFDLGPTLLGALGYDKDYFALGADLLSGDAETYGLSFIDNRFMISSHDAVIFTDSKCSRIEEMYDVSADPALTIQIKIDERGEKMLEWAQAFLQDYTHRLTEGRLR